jgi:hypothetical protein
VKRAAALSGSTLLPQAARPALALANRPSVKLDGTIAAHR